MTLNAHITVAQPKSRRRASPYRAIHVAFNTSAGVGDRTVWKTIGLPIALALSALLWAMIAALFF